MKTKTAHYCPEWDYVWIQPGWEEFDVCMCEASSYEPEDSVEDED